MQDFDERVKQRAYRLWVEEGCPEGRSDVHWDRARELVADEENHKLTTKASAAEEAMRGGHNGGQHPSQNGGQHAAASERPKQQAAPKRVAAAKAKTSGTSKPPKDTGTKRR